MPQPFGGMSVFENLLVAAEFGRADRSGNLGADCAQILERCGLADQANRPAGSLTLLQRKRLELARALATQPQLLLLDEVAGGLTEEECRALVSLVRDVKESGVTIVWIEHIVHALVAVVDRLVVLHGGAFIADATLRSTGNANNDAYLWGGDPTSPADVLATLGADWLCATRSVSKLGMYT
jgi:branched-chain amino acid transport system ATP-binding protein